MQLPDEECDSDILDAFKQIETSSRVSKTTEKGLSMFTKHNYTKGTNTPTVAYWFLFIKTSAEGNKQAPMLVNSTAPFKDRQQSSGPI